MKPATLILDLAEEMVDFRRVLSDDDFPIVDLDATLQLIFESVSQFDDADYEIRQLSTGMAEQDLMFANADFDADACDRIFNAVNTIGNQIKDKLVAMNAYADSRFPYEFRSLINDDTVVLSKIP